LLLKSLLLLFGAALRSSEFRLLFTRLNLLSKTADAAHELM
jgi:hypothetical protein